MPKQEQTALTEAARPFAATLLRMAGKAPASDDPTTTAETTSADRPGDEPETTGGSEENTETQPLVVAGKTYASEEAQRLAHENAQTLLTQLQRENAEMRTAIFTMMQNQSAAQAQQKPAEPDPVMKRLEELGIPSADITALIQREAAKIAGETVNAKVDPLVAAEAAEQHMRTNYPGYAENVGKINEFVRTDIETQNLIMGALRVGDALTAKMIAFARFADQYRGEPTATPAAIAEAKKARAEAKANAGILPGAKSGTSRMEKPNDARERIAQAAQVARRTGNEKPYLTEVVKATFPDLFAYLRTQPR